MWTLEKSVNLDTDVIGHFLAEDGELSTEDKKVQLRDLQGVDVVLVSLGLPPALELETTQVWFDVVDPHAFQALLVVKVSDITCNCTVFPFLHVLQRDDVEIAGWGDKDVDLKHDVLNGCRLEPLTARLQGADQVAFEDKHSRTGMGERAALVVHTVTSTDPRALPSNHHDSRARDAVVKRVTAARHIVEFGLRHTLLKESSNSIRLVASSWSLRAPVVASSVTPLQRLLLRVHPVS